MMKKILVVFGTRPEAIKMCPLIKELQTRDCFETKVCITGQHRQMLAPVMDVFGIEADFNLDIMKERQTLFDITINVLDKIKDVLQKFMPDIVLVHGDTSTTLAASLAAYYLHIAVGHVEAGLRTYNKYSPYPEEFNRQAVSIIAKYNFAPTENAKQNLINEGKEAGSIFVTGNTAIDALKTTVKASYTHEKLNDLNGYRLLLLTAHRRENLGQPMKNMFSAVKKILQDYSDVKVIYPIHFNPIVRETADEIFKNTDRMSIIEPLDVLDFHNFLNNSYIILTDSGGIQEEAPSLGKPVLVMRDTTERPEGIKANTLKLVGTSQDAIYKAIKLLLDDKTEYEKMSKSSNPYGDGFASKKIADILQKEL